MPFPELNLKQAWLIASAVSLPNPNGTAPGWFVGRPDGRVIVALPGPPREMRPMWADEAVPRLQALGLGRRSRPGRTGWRGSASPRSPSCSARRCSGRPTRSSPRMPGSRRSTSGSRRSRSRRCRPTRSSKRRPPSSRASSAATSGRRARRPGATRSAPASSSSAGRSRWSRSAPVAASRRCSVTPCGCASTNRSPPRPRRRRPTSPPTGPTPARRPTPPIQPTRQRPTTSSAMRGGPASSVGRTSAWPSGPGRAAATWRCRSRSWPRPASGTSDASCSWPVGWDAHGRPSPRPRSCSRLLGESRV